MGTSLTKKQRIIKWSIITVIVIVVLFIAALIASNYIIFDKNTKTNLVINNKNVTSNLKNDVLIKDDIIYLSEKDVANFFDKYIYEEPETNQIITTYNKKIAAIGFEENKITVNGSEKDIYASAINENGDIYLPISEMQDVYDIEIQDIPETKVVTIDSLDREQRKAIVSSNISVKSSTNLISKTVDRIKKGSTVVVIETKGKYTRVRTENGKLGYVKSNKLENEYTVRDNMEEEKQINGKVNLVWDYYSTVASAPDRSGTTIPGVNVVSPAFFHLSEDGTLEENIGQSGESYIEWAHSNGYKVWPIFSNAEAGLEVTSEVMNSYTARQKLIEEIIDASVKYDLDGINMDFENMKMEDKDLYSRFIIELTPRLKEIGLVSSVDVTAPDGAETWSMCFDRHVLGDVADYIIFMAYDQYGASSQKPGTTAGYNWVELSLNKFLTTEEIPSEKIILAIPLYTRVWTTDEAGNVTNKSIAMKDIDSTIPDGVEKQWNDELKQNYVEYTDGSDTKQIWIEDEDSLKAKLSLIKENNLGGVAAWEKDMEKDDVWDLINNEIN